jgi:hypothetical protein
MMAEKSWFFTEVGSAPTYGPDDFSAWLYNAMFRNDGVLKGLDNSLAVTSDGAGNALIATGCAMKGGYGYQNTSILTMGLTLPAVGYQNINTLVVRVDSGASPNLMHAYKLVGSSVANPGPPAAPAITAGTDVYLCDILIVNTAGSYAYTVTDKRAFAKVQTNGLLGANWEAALEGAGPGAIGALGLAILPLAGASGNNWAASLALPSARGILSTSGALGVLAVTTDFTYYLTAASTATLPASPVAGQRITFKNKGNFTSTINANSEQTIGSTSSTSFVLYTREDYVTLEWDGVSAWYVIATNGPVQISNQTSSPVLNASVNTWTAIGGNLSLGSLSPGIYDIELDAVILGAGPNTTVSIGNGTTPIANQSKAYNSNAAPCSMPVHAVVKGYVLSSAAVIQGIYIKETGSSATDQCYYSTTSYSVGKITARRVG